MRHLLEYLLLTLLPNFGFCLSLASQDCVKAPRANGCSEELLPVTSVPLQDLEQVRTNVVDSSESNDGYRAAAYYVNWVSDNRAPT
jgi:hypothetical protein